MSDERWTSISPSTGRSGMPAGPEISAMRARPGRAGGRGGIRPCDGGHSRKTPVRSGVQAHEAQMAGGPSHRPAQRARPAIAAGRRGHVRYRSVLPLGAGAVAAL